MLKDKVEVIKENIKELEKNESDIFDLIHNEIVKSDIENVKELKEKMEEIKE